MPDRVGNEDWTPQRVRCALVAAFRMPAGGIVASAEEVERLLNWRRRGLYARVEPRDLAYLMAWARRVAGRESVDDHQREMGWRRSTFQAGWRRAAAAIASALADEAAVGRNAAAFSANEQAEDRLLVQGRLVLPTFPPVTLRPAQSPRKAA